MAPPSLGVVVATTSRAVVPNPIMPTMMSTFWKCASSTKSVAMETSFFICRNTNHFFVITRRSLFPSCRACLWKGHDINLLIYAGELTDVPQSCFKLSAFRTFRNDMALHGVFRIS
mmetsp:Transcript_2269/g.4763  ORF Transcript_2269/g.4763 Transcript_2269/m.4763 type:complete len:116 (-) Transcript_2269:210-557(-)